MENYCENLIFYNMYRPTDFVEYFDPQGPEYVDIDSRFKKWSTLFNSPYF